MCVCVGGGGGNVQESNVHVLTRFPNSLHRKGKMFCGKELFLDFMFFCLVNYSF